MNSRAHTSTPLLLLILLAILLQPLVFGQIFDGGDPGSASAPARDAGLEVAIRELTEALTRRRGGTVSPPATVTDPRLERVLSRLAERLDAAPAAGQLPPPPTAGEPTAGVDYPRRQDRIDAWMRHFRELRDRDEEPPNNLFFHRSKTEVLATFGVPDDAYANGPGATWVYEDPKEGENFRIEFDGDRVSRFWFD